MGRLSKTDKIIKDISQVFSLVDMFELSLFSLDPYGIINTLIKTHGKDVVFDIIDIYGGATIKIPHKNDLENAVLKAAVWNDCVNNNMSKEDAKIKYAIRIDAVRRYVKEYNDLLRNYKLKFNA